MICVATAMSVLTEDVKRACEVLENAFGVTVAPPSWFHFAKACVAFMAGDYQRTVSSSRSGPQEISALVFFFLANSILGHRNEATKAYRHLISIFPNVDLMRFADNFPIVCIARHKEFDRAVISLSEFLAAERNL